MPYLEWIPRDNIEYSRYEVNKEAFLLGIPLKKWKKLSVKEREQKIMPIIIKQHQISGGKLTKKRAKQLVYIGFESKMYKTVITIGKKYGYPDIMTEYHFSKLCKYHKSIDI